MCLRMHFIHRARFLQDKNHTLGSVSDRLQKNLCIITGKPVSPGQIMDSEHFDETLDKLCADLKEHKFWEDLIPEKCTDQQDPAENIENSDYLEKPIPARDLPVFRTGDAFAPKKEKFCYVTPQSLMDHLQSKGQKWYESLLKKAEEANT